VGATQSRVTSAHLHPGLKVRRVADPAHFDLPGLSVSGLQLQRISTFIILQVNEGAISAQ